MLSCETVSSPLLGVFTGSTEDLLPGPEDYLQSNQHCLKGLYYDGKVLQLC